MLKSIEEIVKKLREETKKSNCLYFRVAVLDTVSKLGNLIDGEDILNFDRDIKRSFFGNTSIEKIFKLIKEERYSEFHSFCQERELYYKKIFNLKSNYIKKDLLFKKEWLDNKIPYNECLIKILLSKEKNEITEMIASFYKHSCYNDKRNIEISLLDLFCPDDRTYKGGFADNHFYHLINDSILFKLILKLN